MTTPTDEERQAALARCRSLPRCAYWPDDLAQAMADPVRRQLIDIEAVRYRRRWPAEARPAARRPWTPPPSDLPLFDLKRAASGERDD